MELPESQEASQPRPNGVQVGDRWYAIDWQSFAAAQASDNAPVFVDPHHPADHQPWECDAYGAFLESLGLREL